LRQGLTAQTKARRNARIGLLRETSLPGDFAVRELVTSGISNIKALLPTEKINFLSLL